MLTKAGVGSDVHYPLALHRHPAFGGGGKMDDDVAPTADWLASSLLSLPIQPELMRHQAAIVGALDAALRETAQLGQAP
jgi:dTDP-4-amino-4,6-dideoxygalactose transaminase